MGYAGAAYSPIGVMSIVSGTAIELDFACSSTKKKSRRLICQDVLEELNSRLSKPPLSRTNRQQWVPALKSLPYKGLFDLFAMAGLKPLTKLLLTVPLLRRAS